MGHVQVQGWSSSVCCCCYYLQALFINLQPPAHDGGAAITGYVVVMRCSDSIAAATAASCLGSEQQALVSSDWVEVFRGEYKGSPVPVLHLLPGTQYDFRAAACNDYGTSTHSEVGSARTLPAEPLPPPAPLLVSAAGSSLTVSWQEPYGQGSAVNKYKLSYACLGPVTSSSATAAGFSKGHSRSSSSAAPVSANGHLESGHASANGGETGWWDCWGRGSSTACDDPCACRPESNVGIDMQAAVQMMTLCADGLCIRGEHSLRQQVANAPPETLPLV